MPTHQLHHYAHHERAIDNLVRRYKADPEVIAVIVGGSVAKGNEKADSDLDAMIVVTEVEYQRYTDALSLSFTVRDLCDYEGGYCDLKIITKEYVRKAAQRGSEPTRYQFTGAYCAYTADPELPELMRLIPIYQKGEQGDKIYSFYSQLRLNRGYFWSQANKRNDPYLKHRVATDIVLFGSRLILAHNELLFPCQKWLMEAVEAAPDKPENFTQLAFDLLNNPTTASVNAFAAAVETFQDWGVKAGTPAAVTRFIDDTELWWFKNRPVVAEW